MAQYFNHLSSGDSVEIIAPASRCSDEELKSLQDLLKSWGLKVIVAENIFGKDLICANEDSLRFELLQQSLQRPSTKALIAVRGGYGSMRLIPQLCKLSPASPKLFVGMSDITALNLYLMQKWNWPVLHAGMLPNKFSEKSLLLVKSAIFGANKNTSLIGTPMNNLATKKICVSAALTGGNLSLIAASLATPWQIDADQKIIFFEEINERAYKVDRMLEQLTQANIFKKAKAIIFSDFLHGNEPDGSNKINAILQRFALACPLPVVAIPGIGHGSSNFPIFLGAETELNLGQNISLKQKF